LTTLANLISEFDANAFIFADAGNGCGFGEAGQALDYDEAAAKAHGDVELTKLDAPITSNDGYEVNYASDWIVTGEGSNPYRYRIMF
jgi:hypothetical protein